MPCASPDPSMVALSEEEETMLAEASRLLPLLCLFLTVAGFDLPPRTPLPVDPDSAARAY
jgi:hypothetical protein